jgi:hypothetical protein
VASGTSEEQELKRQGSIQRHYVTIEKTGGSKMNYNDTDRQILSEIQEHFPNLTFAEIKERDNHDLSIEANVPAAKGIGARIKIFIQSGHTIQTEIRARRKPEKEWLREHFKMLGCKGLLRTDSSAYFPKVWHWNATEDRAVAVGRVNALIEILSATDRAGISKEAKELIPVSRHKTTHSDMFDDVEYYEINREERNFEALLFTSILYDGNFRNGFFKLVNEKSQNGLFLNGDDYDIYTEVAMLRDYWHESGADKEKHRRHLTKMLALYELDAGMIDQYGFFWTKDKGELLNPGRWSDENMPDDVPGRGELLKIKRAFNAKPDLLIMSGHTEDTGKNAVLIELKLESDVGKDGAYNQLETFADIIKLSAGMIPALNGANFKKLLIAKDDEILRKDCSGFGLIEWSEILRLGFGNEQVRKYFRSVLLF